MNKWEKLFWHGTNYLIVPNPDPDKSGCRSCAFEGSANLCPRYEGPRKTLYCINHERHGNQESYIIHDTPESVAEYIARSLSS